MTTQNFIDENKTATFKKGDKVVMHGCYEATLDEYKCRVWICSTNSYLDRAKQEVVFLDGFSGCFAVKFLKPVNFKNINMNKEELKEAILKLLDDNCMNLSFDDYLDLLYGLRFQLECRIEATHYDDLQRFQIDD